MELAFRPNDQKPAIAMPPAPTLTATTSTDHTNATTKATLVQPLPKSRSVDTVDGDTSIRNTTKTESTDPFFRTYRLAENAVSTPAMMIPERDTCNTTSNVTKTPLNLRLMPHRPIAGPAKLTIQSTPVKSQPPMLSSNLSSQSKTHQAAIATPTQPMVTAIAANRSTSTAATTTNNDVNGNNALPANPTKTTSMPAPNHFAVTNQIHHKSAIIMRTHNHGGESSDENRSSGHASMSDTGHGSSSPGCGNSHHRGNGAKLGTTGFYASEHIARKNSQDVRKHSIGTRCNESRSRHKVPWNGTGLEDVKLAIQQLTMRSQTSTSTYSSLSAGSESSEPVRRLGRYSSLETVNTNVTSADECVIVIFIVVPI